MEIHDPQAEETNITTPKRGKQYDQAEETNIMTQKRGKKYDPAEETNITTQTRDKKYDKAYRQKINKLKRMLQPHIYDSVLNKKEKAKTVEFLTIPREKSNIEVVDLINSPILAGNCTRSFSAISLAQSTAVDTIPEQTNESSNQTNQTSEEVFPGIRKLQRDEPSSSTSAETIVILPEKIKPISKILTQEEEVNISEKEDPTTKVRRIRRTRIMKKLGDKANISQRRKYNMLIKRSCKEIISSPPVRSRQSKISESPSESASPSTQNLCTEMEELRPTATSGNGKTSDKPEEKSPVPLKILSGPIARLTPKQLSITAPEISCNIHSPESDSLNIHSLETSSSDVHLQETLPVGRGSSRISETTYIEAKSALGGQYAKLNPSSYEEAIFTSVWNESSTESSKTDARQNKPEAEESTSQMPEAKEELNSTVTSGNGKTSDKPEEKSPVPLKILSGPVARLTPKQLSITAPETSFNIHSPETDSFNIHSLETFSSDIHSLETSSSDIHLQETLLVDRGTSRISETTYIEAKNALGGQYAKHNQSSSEEAISTSVWKESSTASSKTDAGQNIPEAEASTSQSSEANLSAFIIKENLKGNETENPEASSALSSNYFEEITPQRNSETIENILNVQSSEETTPIKTDFKSEDPEEIVEAKSSQILKEEPVEKHNSN